MHPLQNPVPARANTRRQLLLRISRRRLNQRGDGRGLFGSYFRCGLAEVAIRGGFDAIEALSQVDLVQIGFEDRCFRIAPFERRGGQHLAKFTTDSFVTLAVGHPHQLLRDRAAALHDAARAKIGETGSGETNEVVAAMLIEPPILGGENRGDQMRRNAAQWDIDPPFGEQREDLTIVDVVERRRLRARVQT